MSYFLGTGRYSEFVQFNTVLFKWKKKLCFRFKLHFKEHKYFLAALQKWLANMLKSTINLVSFYLLLKRPGRFSSPIHVVTQLNLFLGKKKCLDCLEKVGKIATQTACVNDFTNLQNYYCLAIKRFWCRFSPICCQELMTRLAALTMYFGSPHHWPSRPGTSQHGTGSIPTCRLRDQKQKKECI